MTLEPTADDAEPEEWLRLAKRRGALRLVVIGLALLIAGSVWAVRYWSWDGGASPITYVRVVSVLVLGIGSGMTVAGAILLRRARRLALPRATLVGNRDHRE